MNYSSYMKREIEKTIFFEINKDVVLNTKGNPLLKKGEYPILPEDVIELSKVGLEGIPVQAILNGMLYIIACDPDFIYNPGYIEFLKSIDGIESYIIMHIENNKNSETKKAVIFATALFRIFDKKEYGMNRCYLLMELYEKTNNEMIRDEIISSLEKLHKNYPDYAAPCYHLGEYFLDKDMDMAKFYLRKCTEDPMTSEGAQKLLKKIKNTEDYDKAVDMVGNGQGMEALKILVPYNEDNPESLDAKYYTAVAYRQINDNYRALDYLDELLEYPERPEVYNEIALNLAELKDVKSALGYFKKALKITPDDSGIICNIGVCHLDLGETEEAVKAFELASRINPKDEIALKWLKETRKGK